MPGIVDRSRVPLATGLPLSLLEDAREPEARVMTCTKYTCSCLHLDHASETGALRVSAFGVGIAGDEF